MILCAHKYDTLRPQTWYSAPTNMILLCPQTRYSAPTDMILCAHKHDTLRPQTWYSAPTNMIRCTLRQPIIHWANQYGVQRLQTQCIAPTCNAVLQPVTSCKCCLHTEHQYPVSVMQCVTVRHQLTGPSWHWGHGEATSDPAAFKGSQIETLSWTEAVPRSFVVYLSRSKQLPR